MASKKKTEKEITEETEQKAPEIIEETKLPKAEDLFSMKFEGPDGEILMVRKAFRPVGKLEFYTPGD